MAVKLMLDKLNGTDEPKAGEISLDCTIIERESTKVP
jgi:DNA-binding LacI/PurR family transcriptional regulator